MDDAPTGTTAEGRPCDQRHRENQAWIGDPDGLELIGTILPRVLADLFASWETQDVSACATEAEPSS